MKSWCVIMNDHTGEPESLVCGECAEKHYRPEQYYEIRHPMDYYPDKCGCCEKVCGDYFKARRAA